MNKKTVLMVTLAFLLLSASFSIANAQVQREKYSVPFKSHTTATATPVGPPVGDPPILEIVILGSGQATHMGEVSVWQHMFVNVITMEFYGGTFVWTAANGDTIKGEYSGSMVPTSVGFEIHGVFTITDGTGRFEGATGGGTASGMQFPDNTADLRLDGTITSVGSR